MTQNANGSTLEPFGTLYNAQLYVPDQFNPATRQFIWDRIKIYCLDAHEPGKTRPGLQWWYKRHDEEIAMVWVRGEQQRMF